MNTGNRSSTYTCLSLLLLAALNLLSVSSAETDIPEHAPPAVLGPQHLAIIINDADPLSRSIGEYYIAKRGIPVGNVIHVNFKPGKNVMPAKVFKSLKADIDQRTPASVQAYALSWTAPYRVGCMSITTAFAAGYNEDFCAKGCKPTKASPLFNSSSSRPFSDFGWRPAMMLAGEDLAAVEKLIDRGIAADESRPPGTAYLMSTSDKARNVRARFYQGIQLMQSDRFRIAALGSNSLKYRSDVMFYFTGLASVPDIDTNRYLPGAIADHLTSAGGQLTGSKQMSSLRWLAAGATGSYGTVVEPCAFVQKFPRPNVVIDRYLNGETLLEAYWKSVEWPGQGVFIGEPLAAPFRK